MRPEAEDRVRTSRLSVAGLVHGLQKRHGWPPMDAATREVRGVVARRLLVLAIACFVLSLLLPAVRMRIMGPATDIAGFGAGLLSLAGGLATFASIGDDTPRFVLLLPFLAALLNLNFVGAGIWLYRTRGRESTPLRLVAAGSAGVLFACLSPLGLFQDGSLLPGFYVWVLAHGLLLLGGGWGWQANPHGPGG